MLEDDIVILYLLHTFVKIFHYQREQIFNRIALVGFDFCNMHFLAANSDLTRKAI